MPDESNYAATEVPASLAPTSPADAYCPDVMDDEDDVAEPYLKKLRKE